MFFGEIYIFVAYNFFLKWVYDIEMKTYRINRLIAFETYLTYAIGMKTKGE